MTGFTLGGYSPENLNVKYRSGSARPLLSSTEDNFVSIPGKDGALAGVVDFAPKRFELPLILDINLTPSTIESRLQVIADILIDRYGEPVELELIFDDDPNVTYTVRYSGSIEPARLYSHTSGELEIPLIALNPFGLESEDVSSGTITDPTSVSQRISLTNSGNVTTPVEISIKNNGAATIGGFTVKIDYLMED